MGLVNLVIIIAVEVAVEEEEEEVGMVLKDREAGNDL